MNEPVLRGRSQPLAAVLAELSAAKRLGEGRVVLVSGAPGIGKTAFLRAVGEQARHRGFAVGFGAADEPNQMVPGAPLLLALRSGPDPLVDRMAFEQLAAPSAHPLWLAEDIADRLDRRAQRDPVLVVLDDLQWADQLSRFLTRVLAGRLAGSPVVWLLAGRSEAPLLVEDFASSRAFEVVRTVHVRLEPLTRADLMDIAADILPRPLPARFSIWLDLVAGNPLMARELVDGVARDLAAGRDGGQLPATFADRLRADLHRLSAPAGTLLRLAAVWGRPLPAADAEHLLDDRETDFESGVRDRLPEIGASGLVAAPADPITFRHDLVREVVYDDTSALDRARWHVRIAHHLVDSGRSAVEAAPHAAVGARAGDRRCLDILRRAAADSLGVAPQSAAQLMRQAFEAAPRNDPRWAEIGEEYADVLRRAQRGAEAVAVLDLLLSEAADPRDRTRLHVSAAQALWLIGRPAEVVARTERQLVVAPAAGPLRVRLEASRALGLSRSGTPEAAHAAARDALTRARNLSDREGEIIALHALGEVAKSEGRHQAAYDCFHELRTSLGADYSAHEITSLQHLERFDDAQARLDRPARRGGREALEPESPALASAQVWQHFNLGRFDDADAGARALIRLGEELGNYVHRTDARVAMATAAVIHGDLPRAQSIVEEAAAESAERNEPGPGLLLVRARIAHARRDFRAARELLRELSASETAAHTYWSRSLAQMRLSAGIALGAEDREFAAEVVERAAVAARRNPGVPSFAGLALQVSGVVTEDVDQLAAAVDLLRPCRRPLMRASAISDLGSALVRTGRRDDGVRHLEEALAVFLAHDARSSAAVTQRALHAAGVTRRRRAVPGPRPSAGWESLTDTETRVARLVAAGHTNRSAADLLTVSTNTIGTHLSAVFAKLGVRSRVQLTNLMRDLDR